MRPPRGYEVKRTIRLATACALCVTTLGVLDGGVPSVAAGAQDGIPAQKEIDKAADKSTYAGLWGDAAGGVAGRPYVTDLSVKVTEPNGTVHTNAYITGAKVDTPASTTPGDITMTIAPYNLCNKARGDVPAAGTCYESPNRLGAAIGYVANQYGVGTNFSNPTNGNGVAVSTPILDLIKNPENTTEFDVTINMNTWGKTLRWTWLNGVPSFWNITNPGTSDSVLHLKFKLATGPDVLCNTAIPVAGCDPSEPAKRGGGVFAPVSRLKTDFVLSLDDTGVDTIFSGTLFASSNADMGSLSAVPVGSPTLGLTYGVSGANELDGKPNTASFYAFVSDASLLNYFGVTPDVLNAPEFATSETLKVTRADGGTSSSEKWTRWTEADNGTPGYFLDVQGVQFDGTSTSASGVRGAALKKTIPARFTMGNKISNTVTARRSGARQMLTMNSSVAACKKNQCRWVVSRSSSKLKAKSKKLTTVATRRGTGSARVSVAAPKGALISTVLQAKVKGKWRFVTSRMVIGG